MRFDVAGYGAVEEDELGDRGATVREQELLGAARQEHDVLAAPHLVRVSVRLRGRLRGRASGEGSGSWLGA